MKAALIVILSLLFQNSAWSCANTVGSGTKYNGSLTWSPGRSAAGMLHHYLKTDLRSNGTRMEADLRERTDFKDRSDCAVALMYLGRSQEAVTLLQRLEMEKSGEYFVAANLGTAYELAGDNEQALRWIKEGIHRNPKSHEGTEWLHVKILEAKIAQQTDTNYFRKHSILDLQPEKIGSEIMVGEKAFSPREVANALAHQLSERMQFVKPPDAPVASLLFDYAAIEAATRTLESADEVLSLATQYGYPSNQVEPLRRLYENRIQWANAKKYLIYALIGASAIGFLLYCLKRGWMKIGITLSGGKKI
jgi:tetratricopeptide (TPR) repeat protein